MSTSSDDGNRATAHMIRTEFSANSDADVAANGSLSFFPSDPVGENNLATVILSNTSNTNPAPGLLTIFEGGCFIPVDPCPNQARIVPPQ
jgi:hypothetical protein